MVRCFIYIHQFRCIARRTYIVLAKPGVSKNSVQHKQLVYYASRACLYEELTVVACAFRVTTNPVQNNTMLSHDLASLSATCGYQCILHPLFLGLRMSSVFAHGRQPLGLRHSARAIARAGKRVIRSHDLLPNKQPNKQRALTATSRYCKIRVVSSLHLVAVQLAQQGS